MLLLFLKMDISFTSRSFNSTGHLGKFEIDFGV